MNLTLIRDDVMLSLGLTGIVEQERVMRGVNNAVRYILNSYDWSFLCEDDTLPVTSAEDTYDLATNFLRFTKDKLFYYDEGNIKITSEGYVRVEYPRISDLTELKYAVPKGKDKIKFYSVSALSGTKTVGYSYVRRGSSDDLDIDQGFEQIIREGGIMNVAKKGSQEQLASQAIFYNSLSDKQQLWERIFGGESRFKANEHTVAFQIARTGIRWI